MSSCAELSLEVIAEKEVNERVLSKLKSDQCYDLTTPPTLRQQQSIAKAIARVLSPYRLVPDVDSLFSLGVSDTNCLLLFGDDWTIALDCHEHNFLQSDFVIKTAEAIRKTDRRWRFFHQCSDKDILIIYHDSIHFENERLIGKGLEQAISSYRNTTEKTVDQTVGVSRRQLAIVHDTVLQVMNDMGPGSSKIICKFTNYKGKTDKAVAWVLTRSSKYRSFSVRGEVIGYGKELIVDTQGNLASWGEVEKCERYGFVSEVVVRKHLLDELDVAIDP